MNSIYQHYIIDLSSNNNFVQIPTVQGDGNGIRGFEVELIQNGVPYVIDQNDTFIFIMGTKPDTKQIMNDCALTEQGSILVDITSQMSAVNGCGNYQIVLMSRSTNSQLKSFPFYIITTPSAFDMDYIASSDEFQSLTRNITRTEEVIDEANTAISDIRTLESSVKNNEESRVSAENGRVSAESSRVSNENIRITNENNRQTAETNRADAENNRISAEASRVSNENIRKTNENNRQTAEANRADAESARVSSEAGRVNAENSRETNEDARKAAETARQTAETTRNDAENTRISNESTRQTNESVRQTNTTTAITNANNAANRANNAAETCESFIEAGVVLQSEKGIAGGVATLDSGNKIPLDQIPGNDLPISTNVQTALDSYYQQSSGYTDQKIAGLINGAPSTLDTLGEIAQAMKDNKNVVDALDEAVGKKTNDAEFDSHVKDNSVHIKNGVADNSIKWNGKSLICISENAFQNLATKDQNTIYFRYKG